MDVVSSYVKMQKRGGNYIGLCPFHNEKTPSFSVSPSKQIYYCFGCHRGGNVIKFVMDYENFGFQETLRHLAERAGIALPEEEPDERQKKEANIKERLREIHKAAATYFYYQLHAEQGKRAKDYFLGRGLSEQTLTRFGLGYAGKSGSDLYRYLKSKGYDDGMLKESGLVSIEERGARDKFWNRAMFPILDTNNRVIAFGGRVLGEGMPKYLNSPETKLFDKSKSLYALNFARQSQRDYFILCEGYMDVIALHQAGYTNAVAALGTAFTPEHALLIKRYVQKLIISFDSDGAGVSAAKRALPILKEAGLGVRILNLLPYKDPDEFLKNCGAEALEKRIEEAKNSFIWEMEQLQKQYDLKDPEQQTAFHRGIAERLADFSQNLERDNYTLALARELMIPYEDLKQLVQSVAGGVSIRRETEKAREDRRKFKREDPLMKSQSLLLTWMIENPSLIEKIRTYIKPEDLQNDLYKELLEKIYSAYDEGKLEAARIIGAYIEDEEKCKLVAAVFNSNLQMEVSAEEKKLAIQESILKIKDAALEQKSLTVTDAKELMRIVQEKQDLKKLQIRLD